MWLTATDSNQELNPLKFKEYRLLLLPTPLHLVLNSSLYSIQIQKKKSLSGSFGLY